MNYLSANKRVLFILTIILLLFQNCKKTPIDQNNSYELTFNEDFLEPALDTNIWDTHWDQGIATNEDNQQLFIDSAFVIQDGILHIMAKRDTVIGIVHDASYNYIHKEFYLTSGIMNTAKSFAQQFGYFEIRCKVPYGKSFWPAFWMMPYAKWPPEIDVFEISGEHPEGLHMTNHFTDKNGKTDQVSTTIDGPDLSRDFHVYAIEWTPTELIWYLDNVEVFRTNSGIPQERMYLIVNLSIGRGPGYGQPDQTTPLPNSMDIDYIRVYQKKK